MTPSGRRGGIKLGTKRLVSDIMVRTRGPDDIMYPRTAQHRSYWRQYPGNFEHWRFVDGFTEGWEDAWQFFFISSRTQRTGFISELGFTGPWGKRRSQVHAHRKGNGNIWEYGKASFSTALR